MSRIFIKKEPKHYIRKKSFFSITWRDIHPIGASVGEYESLNPWESVDTIWGKILDVTDYKVVIKCLVNEDDKSFEIRKFDKTPFLGAVTLKTNQFVEIKIFTRSGERRFTYQNAARKDLAKIFKPRNYFKGLENSPFFKPLSSKNENNF